MTRLVNEADIVNKTRPLFTLSLEMTRLVNETRLLLVPCVNSDIYGIPPPMQSAEAEDILNLAMTTNLRLLFNWIFTHY